MSQQRPTMVAVAIGATWALVALQGVTAVLSILLKSELVDAWESRRVDTGSVEAPDIMPVMVVMLVVVALLMLVLLEFFRSRHGWARVALTVMIIGLALGTLATLRIAPPAVFVVVAVTSLVVDAVVLAALWHRDTGVYLRAADRSADVRSDA